MVCYRIGGGVGLIVLLGLGCALWTWLQVFELESLRATKSQPTSSGTAAAALYKLLATSNQSKNETTNRSTFPAKRTNYPQNDDAVQYLYCPNCSNDAMVPLSSTTMIRELSPRRIQWTTDPFQKDVIWWTPDQDYNDSALHERSRVGDDWKLLLIDLTDTCNWGAMQRHLFRLQNVTNNRVYLIVRTISKGKKLRREGTLLNFTDWLQQGVVRGVKPYHFPVRNDIVDALEEQQKKNETTARSLDIAHFWNANETKKSVSSKRRSAVSKTVQSVGQQYNFTYFVDIVGHRGKGGRNGVHPDYIRALLQYKIVVVCQRDAWYDHFRLMEALVGGALVMTDQMPYYPAGVVDKETVVVYHGQDDLARQLVYYMQHKEERLKIAAAGQELSMTRHRLRHRWEDLLLGDWEHRDDNGYSILDPGDNTSRVGGL